MSHQASPPPQPRPLPVWGMLVVLVAGCSTTNITNVYEVDGGSDVRVGSTDASPEVDAAPMGAQDAASEADAGATSAEATAPEAAPAAFPGCVISPTCAGCPPGGGVAGDDAGGMCVVLCGVGSTVAWSGGACADSSSTYVGTTCAAGAQCLVEGAPGTGTCAGTCY